MFKFGERKHPVFRSTSPLSRGVLKSKGGGKLSIHFCAGEGTIETVFRPLISVNQLSIYGAVSDLCDECKSCHVRTGRLVLVGQSDPLFVTTSVMKTPLPLTDDPAQEDLLQKYQDRVDNLPRDEKSSEPEGWIRVNTKSGPVLEVTTSYLQGKYGVEIRIESVNKDDCHSWGQNVSWLEKLVTELSNKQENDNNEQETSEMQFEKVALKSNARAFESRSKAKAKPQRRTPCQLIHKNFTHRRKKVD